MRKFRYLKKFENFKDLDDVLDKISKKGYVSLNDKEKEYIENWNEKAKLDRNIDVLENTSFIIEIKDIDEEVDFYNFNVVLRYKKDNKKYKGNIVIDKLNPINFDYYLKDNTGNDIDISPIDFYELDSLIQSMVEKNINENFIPINESNKNNYDILSQNFVKEKNNKYYIWNIMENKWVTLSFSNLLRFLLFSYITQYNKDDEILLQIKNDVNNENYTNLVKYYDMLASNNTFYRKNIKDILNVDMSGKNLNKIYDLVTDGHYMQINVSSLYPQHPNHKLVKKLLSHQLVHFVATDAHDLSHRPMQLDYGYQFIKNNYGKKMADALFFINPQKVINNENIKIEEYQEIKSKRFLWF
ncbi:MAG: CpsB/CapC family capsule biosynthesis tyrosine phosphatase [archaeon]